MGNYEMYLDGKCRINGVRIGNGGKCEFFLAQF